MKVVVLLRFVAGRKRFAIEIAQDMLKDIRMITRMLLMSSRVIYSVTPITSHLLSKVLTNRGKSLFLVFDFDGTLADTHVAFREAFDEAAGTMNVQPFREKDAAYLKTLEASDVLRAHEIAPEQFAEFTGLLKQGMEKRHSEICLVPGVADALSRLSSMKNALGLVTSNSEPLVRSVLSEHIGLFQYQKFDVSIHAKSSALENAASECSSFGTLHYVGDEIRDFRAAMAADMGFSAVTWGYNTEAALREEGCESFIRDPSELARLGL